MVSQHTKTHSRSCVGGNLDILAGSDVLCGRDMFSRYEKKYSAREMDDETRDETPLADIV